jgi:hypothetical protein
MIADLVITKKVSQKGSKQGTQAARFPSYFPSGGRGDCDNQWI